MIDDDRELEREWALDEAALRQERADRIRDYTPASEDRRAAGVTVTALGASVSLSQVFTLSATPAVFIVGLLLMIGGALLLCDRPSR